MRYFRFSSSFQQPLLKLILSSPPLSQNPIFCIYFNRIILIPMHLYPEDLDDDYSPLERITEIQHCFHKYSAAFQDTEKRKFEELQRDRPLEEAVLAYLKSAFDINADIKWLSKEKQFEFVIEKVELALGKLIAQYSESSARRECTPGTKERLLDWLELKTAYESLQNEIKKQMVEKINEGLDFSVPPQPGNEDLRRVITSEVKLGSMKEYRHLFKAACQYKIKTDVDNLKFGWDQFDEAEYNSYIRHTREQLTTISKGSPNWSSLGTRHKINTINGLYRNKLQRDEIIERYLNRDWVTAEQVKFIANTSKVSSKCIDKEKIQRIVNQAKPEVIARLEFEIAQNIINNYYSLKDKINTLRHNYLKNASARQKHLIALNQHREQEARAHEDMMAAKPALKKAFSIKLKFHKKGKPQLRSEERIDPTKVIHLEEDEDATEHSKEINNQKRKELLVQLRHRRSVSGVDTHRLYSQGPKALPSKCQMDVKLIQHFFLRKLTRKRLSQ